MEEEKPDVRMPGMSYELCEHVRSDPGHLTLPVIMVMAPSAPEQPIQGIKAGATDFISKPLTRENCWRTWKPVF